MIVMGAALALIAWRMVRRFKGWAAGLILGGALLLAFGYAVLMPLYDSGVIETFRPGDPCHGDSSAVMAWHVVKLFAMNAGWLMFGLGFALHARLLAAPTESESLAA